MKRTGELIGRPIISLVDGCEIGTVKSFVFNSGEASVAAIIVDDGKSYRGAKLIAFSDILGVGESALTIEQKNTVKSVDQAPELEKLLETNLTIINTKVLTKKGEIKGTITEVQFDTDSGKIIECYSVDEKGNEYTIPASSIYTYGTGITVITAEGDKAVTSYPKSEQPKAATPQQNNNNTTMQQAKPEPKLVEAPKVIEPPKIAPKVIEAPKAVEQPKAMPKVVETPKVVEQPKAETKPVEPATVEAKPAETAKVEEKVVEVPKAVEQPMVEAKPAETAKVEPTPTPKASDIPAVEDLVPAVESEEQTDDSTADSIKAMRKFEERQKKFLIGKKATRKIVTDNGTEIIDQGEEVTKEIIQKANLAGKFVELSMSVQ